MIQSHTQALVLATEHMQRLGYEVIASEFHTRWGTLDIIASRDDTVVFAFVGMPDRTNTARMNGRRMACVWLADKTIDRPRPAHMRFDNIEVGTDEDGRLVSLDHLEGAL